jgi:hypothetical protein
VRLAEPGGTPFSGTPAAFSRPIADETEKWAKWVKPSLGQGRLVGAAPPNISVIAPLRGLQLITASIKWKLVKHHPSSLSDLADYA